MPVTRFLQIHSLHSYPAALLNRDDSGLAKRLTFGGAVRTRISSQCLKRHWRMSQDEFSLRNIAKATAAVRSRNVIGRGVMQPLRSSESASPAVLDAIEEAFNIGLYGKSGTSESGRQPLLLGLPEVEYLRQRAEGICAMYTHDANSAKKEAENFFSKRKGEGSNLEVFRAQTRLPAGIEGALFGRMVTSDPAANIDAAVHVAHAFTVHGEESESDYFSVVDDLQYKDEDAGAAHIGDMELTAGLFYSYVVVDIPSLVSNLEGCRPEEWEKADRELSGKVVEHLIHLIATVSPGAKLGSTAPYSYADLMLVEAGIRQPRSLANAFRQPTKAQVAAATKALTDHLSELDEAYGAKETRRVMSVRACNVGNAERLCLDELAEWTADAIRKNTAD